jgi:hypothetical protein
VGIGGARRAYRAEQQPCPEEHRERHRRPHRRGPDQQAERQQPGALEPIHEHAERDRGHGPHGAERGRQEPELGIADVEDALQGGAQRPDQCAVRVVHHQHHEQQQHDPPPWVAHIML